MPKKLSILLMSLIMCLAGRIHAADAEDYAKVSQLLVTLYNASDYGGIYKLYNVEMAHALPLDKTTAFFEGLHNQFGKLEKLGPPKNAQVAMIYPAQFERGKLDMQIALDESGRIAGMYFKPPTSAKPAPKSHQTQLALPLNGKWLVFWGGDTKELNYHHTVPNQQFAFDLIGVGSDGKTHKGEGTRNEDFYAFGRDVLAPADGRVIEVIDGVRDNKPGSMNPYSALGNCVVLQHRESEVSVFAHFKQGTIKVKPGDEVKKGQVLGACGNSGNSSEPHIHYHLQHSPIIQDGLGIKVIFSRVVVTRDGKTETRTNYSPIKGDIISPE
jgi:murein DD-endopeptidase MepM/ murein hydrolase activator NlpD